MRKIPPEYENPVDNLFIYISEKTSPFYKALNFSPNILTTISLIFGLLSSVFFFYKNYKLSALMLIISYYYDCIDGFYARKYKMVSKFGDLYDHVADIFKVSLLLLLMFIRSKSKMIKLLPIFLIFGILMLVHIRCQENYYGKKESASLDFTSITCPGNLNKTIKITKYFGCGTFILFLTFIIYTFDKF